MIYSEAPCNAAGVFTTNVVKAAPVQYDREMIDKDAGIRSVVINAGIANACTGADGLRKCRETAVFTGKCLNISPDSVLLSSTGVIGMSLPLDKVKKGVEALSKGLDSSPEAGNMAAKAIMTTDTHEKESAYSFTAGGRTCHIGGMTKGAGMIHPNLGTMLCFITTDCAVSSAMIEKALKADVRDTFNMISVDGDTSTNDTCVVLANQMAKNDLIDTEGADFDAFKEALFSVMHDLCIQIIRHKGGDLRLQPILPRGTLHSLPHEACRDLRIILGLSKPVIFCLCRASGRRPGLPIASLHPEIPGASVVVQVLRAHRLQQK